MFLAGQQLSAHMKLPGALSVPFALVASSLQAVAIPSPGPAVGAMATVTHPQQRKVDFYCFKLFGPVCYHRIMWLLDESVRSFIFFK